MPSQGVSVAGKIAVAVWGFFLLVHLVASFVPSHLRVPTSATRKHFWILQEKSNKNDDNNDNYNNNNDNNDNTSDANFAVLAKRIQELQEKEAREQDAITMGLSNRVLELTKSEETLDMIQSQSQIELPVLSFDALLPKQPLEGRSEDPTFCRFLRDLGLGGWFVMTSLSPKTRKLRRHAVIAKIEAVDSIAGSSTTSTTAPPPPSLSSSPTNNNIPTAVDFCIVGHCRCRITGPRTNMKQRIGRWRRAYDPDCEESVLGWGTERFVDAPEVLDILEIDADELEDTIATQEKTTKCTEWSSVLVECNLEDVDRKQDQMTLMTDMAISEKFESLLPMVEEWYELASNVNTYKNTNVTASTRIRKGEPGLWVDPKTLLQQVRNSLGPRPKDPTHFCFWAAALINPLPVLGASLEIRGQLLEAPTLEKRLQVLEWGLIRSIDNLKGKRPI